MELCSQNVTDPKRKQPVYNISVDRWFEHFKALLGKDIDTDSDDLVGDEDGDLNRKLYVAFHDFVKAFDCINFGLF